MVLKGRSLFTSESVTEGHPDKLADQISDAVLDAILAKDSLGRVACETLLTTGFCFIAGEITTSAYVDFQRVARQAIRDVGYTDTAYGLDAASCAVVSVLGIGNTPRAGLTCSTLHGFQPHTWHGLIGRNEARRSAINEACCGRYQPAADAEPKLGQVSSSGKAEGDLASCIARARGTAGDAGFRSDCPDCAPSKRRPGGGRAMACSGQELREHPI